MLRLLVVLLLLIANAVLGEPAPALPDTAPGKLMAKWLEALNKADEAGLAKFTEEHYAPGLFNNLTPAQIAERQQEMRNTMGKFDLYQIEESSPTDLTVVLKAGEFLTRYTRLSYKVDSAVSSKIQERKIAPISAPPEAAPRKMSAADLAKELEPKLEELTAKDAFSGTALIAKDGNVVWQKAYGLQDREAKTPVDLETRFRLGSMNKMFTSVAIAQLVEKGKLKFTDTLATALPDYPNKETAQKITVEHLLTHSSGLGDIFGPAFGQKKDSLRELKDYLPLFADQPLRFEPGKGFSYSNAGFIVLGLVIEKASGQNYYDYVQKNIYDAAGMKASGNVPKDETIPNYAIGYMHGPDGALAPNTRTLPWRGMSAGGGDSNVGDLLRFATALRTNKLLSPAMTDAITTGKTQPGSDRSYAYGFNDGRSGGRRVVGHGGGAPGMNGELSILWDEGYTVIALANLDPPAADNVASYIVERLN
ncbi:MAG: beta-lactamase family protein [Verrucomicrobiota bacterium]|nr:beta-lactamase family protein [Verrucomicrobiota bacterium]